MGLSRRTGLALGVLVGGLILGCGVASISTSPTPANAPTPTGAATATGVPSPTSAATATSAPSPTVPPSATSAATATPSGPPATPPVPPHARRGLVVSQAQDDAAIAHALAQTGSTAWYRYGDVSASGPARRVQLLLSGSRMLAPSEDARIQRVAGERPGSYWIIGNEPNVPHQDWIGERTADVGANAAEYARSYRRYRDVVRAADPTARFVIGNTLNLDANCGGCEGGYVSGREFLTRFVQAYGAEIPADTVWGIHTYRIDWEKVPMVETAEPIRELEAFRGFVDGLPGQAGKPIWLTEFGVVWGYPTTADCNNNGKLDDCGQPFQIDAVDRYVATMARWLEANGERLRIERWFLFANHGMQEPYADVFGGISLLDAPSATARLTRLGRTYVGS